jgi:hypothetical protein
VVKGLVYISHLKILLPSCCVHHHWEFGQVQLGNRKSTEKQQFWKAILSMLQLYIFSIISSFINTNVYRFGKQHQHIVVSAGNQQTKLERDMLLFLQKSNRKATCCVSRKSPMLSERFLRHVINALVGYQ